MDKKAPDRMAQQIAAALNEALEAEVIQGDPEGLELVLQQFTFRLLKGRWRIFLDPAWTPPRKDPAHHCNKYVLERDR